MSSLADSDDATVIALEQRLLDPQVRHDREALLALLHEDFSEFGVSGRIFDRDAIVEALLASEPRPVSAFDFEARTLGTDAVLLTYRTDRPALRTSIWVRGADGRWRVLHHQGTPLREGA